MSLTYIMRKCNKSERLSKKKKNGNVTSEIQFLSYANKKF